MHDPNIWGMLKELCEIESGLSECEVNFINRMVGQKLYSQPQALKIVELYDEHCSGTR